MKDIYEYYLELTNKDDRPSWQEMWMQVARIVSTRSKDPHTKVGAVLVKNNHILSIGYNGEPKHLKLSFDWSTEEKYDYVIHAEMNAIVNANELGLNVKDSDIYVTLSPCKECIKLLIQSEIKNIYYLDEYKDFDKVKYIADNSDIKLIKMKKI